MRTMPAMTRPRSLLVAAGLLAVVIAVAIGATGITLSRLSASRSSSSSTVASGTVTLSTAAVHTCNETGMLPGATAPAACTLKATYSGTVSAYLGLDVLIATKSGTPGTIALYNPSDSTKDLQVTISDNQGSPVTYVTPSTSFGSALTSCPAGSGFDNTYTCYQLTDLLVSTTAFTSSSSADTFSTQVGLPSNNPTGYQGGTASIVLTVHAVQSGNQSLDGCTAGSSCSAIAWS